MKKNIILALIVALLLIPASLFAEGPTYNIGSFADLKAAVKNANSGTETYEVQTWNITKDFTIEESISVSRKGMRINIVGNDHTLTAKSNSNNYDHVFTFRAARSKEVTVDIKNLTLIIDKGFRFGIALQRVTDSTAGSARIHSVFENVNIKSVHTQMPKKQSNGELKTSAPLLVKDSYLTFKGNCTIVTDEFCYSAIDITNGSDGASVTFDINGHFAIEDNRSNSLRASNTLVHLETESGSTGSIKVVNPEYAHLGAKYNTATPAAIVGYNLHDWTFAADGNTIKATCGFGDCTYHYHPAVLTLAVYGKTANLTATVEPEFASDKSLKWESSKESVATVDQNGTVTAVGKGTAVITASTLDGSYKTASCKVEVQ